jgi:predicted CoA-binding protein
LHPDHKVTKEKFMQQEQAIRHILSHCKTVAVVGLSPKAHRDSYGVAQYMQLQGWRMIPINPNAREVLGERAYATLAEAAAHEKIDLVDVFRNSEEVPPVVEEAIALGLPALWLQLGVRHDAAVAKAQAAGMVTVQDKCLKVEHARLRL